MMRVLIFVTTAWFAMLLAKADTIFTTSGSDAGGSVSGQVTFVFSNCVTSPSNTCTLDVLLSNTQANPTDSGQLISDLTFVLTNGQTALTVPGTLSSTISDGSGGAVGVVDFQNGNSTTTTLPASWQFSFTNSTFLLNDLTGGQPHNMIIGPDPYTNHNASLNDNTHGPSLGPIVDFQVTDFPGLTLNTTVSSVVFSWGTGPDGFTDGTLCTDCGGGASGSSIPEPGSCLLMGTGLGGFMLLRKRIQH